MKLFSAVRVWIPLWRVIYLRQSKECNLTSCRAPRLLLTQTDNWLPAQTQKFHKAPSSIATVCCSHLITLTFKPEKGAFHVVACLWLSLLGRRQMLHQRVRTEVSEHYLGEIDFCLSHATYIFICNGCLTVKAGTPMIPQCFTTSPSTSLVSSVYHCGSVTCYITVQRQTAHWSSNIWVKWH